MIKDLLFSLIINKSKFKSMQVLPLHLIPFKNEVYDIKYLNN